MPFKVYCRVTVGNILVDDDSLRRLPLTYLREVKRISAIFLVWQKFWVKIVLLEKNVNANYRRSNFLLEKSLKIIHHTSLRGDQLPFSIAKCR